MARTLVRDVAPPLQELPLGEHHSIPTCYEKCRFQPGYIFRARITRIYDPSKFWMVIKYQELEIFQKHLFRLYYTNKNEYRVPISNIKKNMYCVAFTDGGYFRGQIVGFPCDLEEEPQVQILFIDYAVVKTIEVKNIFFLEEKCSHVPQFVVRATFADIRPYNTHNWTTDCVKEFFHLAYDKNLTGVVKHVDVERQVLYVDLREEEEDGVATVPFHKILTTRKYARAVDERGGVEEDRCFFEPKLKYPYLFPSHAVIESGKVPDNLGDMKYHLEIARVLSPLTNRYK